jgi:hypothetical protein
MDVPGTKLRRDLAPSSEILRTVRTDRRNVLLGNFPRKVGAFIILGIAILFIAAISVYFRYFLKVNPLDPSTYSKNDQLLVPQATNKLDGTKVDENLAKSSLAIYKKPVVTHRERGVTVD